ncbi:MBL fold metallo-hydrolase [Halopseudomonas salegens]|uniref:Phosphoribosyl 1,2-cyclic phosphodiesterase n=1 Tax=Halopseudomonas salegens TaxID=1434072 RepID=A0A1H2G0R0_9GAMM|nr:MBL fold metallo-hydrolase [Halopseudomonas salegens]SDU13157.1 Phosphoribosyl 1,2-cyclic phosphodiesterase [Halopseudomonas salegens]
MRYCSLGSGSKGNATVIEHGGTRLLVDCGFSLRSTEQRLAVAGLHASQLTAILVTHEHSDHVHGVEKLARRYNLPVFMTAGTRHALGLGTEGIETLALDRSIEIGDLRVESVAVPHDAREPCQFIVENDTTRFGLLTDTGMITPWIIERYQQLDGLLLEANYDPDMLASGPYPPRLKARVGGQHGHLSNQQAAGLLAELDRQRLKHLAVAHISEKNNHPDLARDALSGVLADWSGQLLVACQNQGLPWQPIHQAA